MKEKFRSLRFSSVLHLIRSALLLLACLAAGRGISWLIDGLLPGSIIGMLLLTLALATGVLKLDWVEPGAGLLLRWLSLLFIPISVALVDQLDVLARHGLSMLVTISLSTLLVLAFAGRFWQWLETRK